jgi:hypothetical protein
MTAASIFAVFVRVGCSALVFGADRGISFEVQLRQTGCWMRDQKIKRFGRPHAAITK